ncbi:PilZ domain-containing protein [Blastochloris sulfoviridis]|uniref:PilZ domain-containing protein n=1 Tax=Blastochloris sulfoviridis TaxID=50712 RepID=A0A5M6I5Z4_9HYPH|nr:PilZ domain-containing protein [Blastochloris sulfoviridis]KAA5603666.1 PilZ domain-containing protein [Blastochloris sulfoviridis]
MADAAHKLRLNTAERRRHQRVPVTLLGRFMLEDQQEYPCQTINMSPGGVALIAPVLPRKGERVVAYIDQIGRIEGSVARVFEHGFAMTISGTLRRREKLAEVLTWLANRGKLGLPEDRRHARLAPRDPRSIITLPTGSTFPCLVVDVSLSGAAVRSEIRPPVGTRITLGRTPARVVRQLENGFAVEFARYQQLSTLEEELRIPDPGF